jgi:hypothetical protein
MYLMYITAGGTASARRVLDGTDGHPSAVRDGACFAWTAARLAGWIWLAAYALARSLAVPSRLFLSGCDVWRLMDGREMGGWVGGCSVLAQEGGGDVWCGGVACTDSSAMERVVGEVCMYVCMWNVGETGWGVVGGVTGGREEHQGDGGRSEDNDEEARRWRARKEGEAVWCKCVEEGIEGGGEWA